MRARRLTATAVVLAVMLVPQRAFAEAAGGQGGAGNDSVGSWVVGSGLGGGVRSPAGTTCGPWDRATNQPRETGPADVGTVRTDPSGMTWTLYFRVCEATVQYVWVPTLGPDDLGPLAFDELVKKL